MSRPAVLVTGGAKRIGAASVRAFADAGWHVLIHCNRSAQAARDLASALPSAEVIQRDLGKPGHGVAMIEELASQLEDWRLLVNSAAIFPFDSVEQLDPAVFSEVMRVNAMAPVEMAQAFLKLARTENGRRVIQITDQKTANPNPDFFSYTMSKHALAGSVPMMGMAADSADRVYALAPGAILASHDQSLDEAEHSHRMNLLGRRTDASEIAEAILFLAQGWLEGGQTLFIDSGQHLLRQPRDVLFLAREDGAG